MCSHVSSPLQARDVCARAIEWVHPGCSPDEYWPVQGSTVQYSVVLAVQDNTGQYWAVLPRGLFVSLTLFPLIQNAGFSMSCHSLLGDCGPLARTML